MGKTRSLWLLVAAALSMGEAHARPESTKAVVWPADEIAWSDSAAMKGARIAVLWGDPGQGSYGALKRLPAGASLALHTHPYEHKVLCVSGTIALGIEEAAPKDLAPGSYALIPAGTKHKAACRAGADCVYLEQSPGRFDVQFVK